MVKGYCPNLKISPDGAYESAPYFECRSNKWDHRFALNDTDRAAIRKYCCTGEHRRCIMSDDFDDQTPEDRRLKIITRSPILEDST